MPTSAQEAQYGFAERWLPRLVLAPSFLLTLVFLYGFILWNGYLSFTASRLMPNLEWVGMAQYQVLFENERWWVAVKNLFIFAGLFIGSGIAHDLPLPYGAFFCGDGYSVEMDVKSRPRA
jgi:glucose/mannose transport system permease protein